ncbi:MAG: hypothetical protein OXS30_11305 [Chloroflexota bacterium]|nr:hypothetical protein [Chloroflexota bacterium]
MERRTELMAAPRREAGHDTEAGPAPLWLPKGSVRAVIALGVIGVWALLETGAVGVEASDAVRSIAIAIAAGYGLLRARDGKSGGSE